LYRDLALDAPTEQRDTKRFGKPGCTHSAQRLM